MFTKRSLTASVALVVALSGAATLLPAASASAVTKTLISEAVTPSVITYGAGQSITGRLVTAGSRAKLSATKVTIQRRVNGTTTWVNWMSTKTNLSGYYKVSYHPARSYQYRARFAGTVRFGPATSTSRLGAVRAKVSATLAPGGRSLTVGEVATYTGTVQPRLSTQRVLVEEAVAGKWLTVASKAPSVAGKYTVAWRPTKVGLHTYRVQVTPGTRALSPGYSAGASITAFRWLWLSDLPTTDPSIGNFFRGSQSVGGGTTYPHSVWMYTSPSWNRPSRQWDLARKCTTFNATVGIADTSQIGTAGGLQGFSDATLLFSRVQVWGGSTQVTSPLLGGLRLRLQGSYTGSYTAVTWGNARIRCSF